MDGITNDIKEVMSLTWPMIVLTIVVLIIFRVAYLIKNKQKFVLYHELLLLLFVIYILSLFQIVTSQDVSGVHGINITLFKELTRYEIGSHLFYRNILGNIALFAPFGFFSSYYLNLDKKRYIILLTFFISLVIEVIQLQIGRAFDVDDVILNIIGGLIGYFIYVLINKVCGKFSDNVKGIITLILAMIAFAVLVWILL